MLCSAGQIWRRRPATQSSRRFDKITRVGTLCVCAPCACVCVCVRACVRACVWAARWRARARVW